MSCNPLFNLRLPPEVIQAIKDVAAEEGRTYSDLIREEIYNMLERKGKVFKTA